MECAEVETLLVDWLHEELDDGTASDVSAHLHGCVLCRRRLDELRPLHDTVVPLHLPALVENELEGAPLALVKRHLEHCFVCAQEYDDMRAVNRELVKNLGQYGLPQGFTARIMREWKPSGSGGRSPAGRPDRGLGAHIARAAQGNRYAYERLIDIFKGYAYLAAFFRVRDFQWAQALAREIFTGGIPFSCSRLSRREFLSWLETRCDELAEERRWFDDGAAGFDEELGLSGYAGSNKLRRHRRILSVARAVDRDDAYPFLLHYVQRMRYPAIGVVLDIEWEDVFLRVARATRAVAADLERDEEEHAGAGAAVLAAAETEDVSGDDASAPRLST